jgi:hypothetical protein
MKRNNAFALILLGMGLSIGCKSSQQSDVNPIPAANTTTQSTTGAQSLDPTNTQPVQYCEMNCEEKALYAKPLRLTPDEQNSLNHALNQSADGQTHVEGTEVNGAIQFHTVPGPVRVTPNTPQITIPSGADPKQIVRIPLTPEAVQLARPRTAAASH